MQTPAAECSQQPATLPASFAQQRMWFLERFEGGALYNVPFASWLRGSLNVDALRRALSALVERHESLRTVFELHDGVPRQVINPPMPVSLKVTDLTGGGDDARRRALELASEEAREPFDLSVGPLFRAALIKAGEEEHLLVLTLHHIITDAWSMGVLKGELSRLYGAFAAGEAVELPALEIQYGDYAVWQREWLHGGGLDGQLAHWKQQLAGAPPLLEMPTDRPRPSRQTFRGATVRTMLPLDLSERVRALGEREGATMFITLLAAFAVLLSRYSGQQDIVIGSPVANRNRVELEPVIGLFVNTLALRMDLTGEPSFAALVRRAREIALQAFANQDVPFERLVEELRPERHLSHAPVTQVLFVVQSATEQPAELPGLAQERVQTDRGTAKFDLSLFATETREGLRVAFEYAADLFEEATVQRMLEHFQRLLEGAVAEPDRPVSRLPISSAGEQALMLETFNDTERAYHQSMLRPVHELVADQARRSPHAIAVASASDRLTYGELDASANTLAHRLQELGVRPGVVVAICAERSIEMAIAVLAVLKAGGAYAPIDPSYPQERIAFMLQDTDTPVLLTQDHLLARLPAHHAQAICLDAKPDPTARHDDDALASGATLDDLAYVIYTSGSTGRPKGVEMPHRPLANLLAWQLENWSGAACTLQFASLSFDVAFQELFSTWASGGQLLLIEEGVRRDPQALLAILRRQAVERIFLPFVALESLCDAAEYTGQSLPSLREAITAGEQLKVTDSLRRFFARHPHCTLVNQYGPTESHVVSAFALQGASAGWPKLPPIGRPIANSRIYLLDRHRQPVPIGVPGELYIGGASLARGYLARPELTAERFLADPYSDAPGARMYRTGDLASRLPDGSIQYIGRVDHQLKIRGFRVEPGEIEATLRTHPAVRDAVVLAIPNGEGQQVLISYVVGERDAATQEELREHLGARLPDYMIPAAIIVRDALPLTPNGKVDRARLSAEALAGVPGERRSAAPRTDTERQLAAIWTRLLAIDEVGVHDDFFDLGGHSLLAVRLFSEIERRLGVHLPLSALFEQSTIAGIASLIERERHAQTEWSSLVPMRRANGRAPLFLIGWAGGEVLPYRELVQHLDPTLPVFGLRAPGVDRRTPPLASVEDLASYYLREVRRVQRHGPYRLGGFCFSGLVAYEMARKLREEGEAVELLALIDAYPYRPPRRRNRIETERVKLQAFKKADLHGKAAWARARAVNALRLLRSTAYLRGGPRIYELLSKHDLQRLMPRRPWNLVLVASNLARRNYVPQPLDVDVAFFRAQRGPDSSPTPWEGLALRGVKLRQIIAPDISHDLMMHEPHVRLLAAEFEHVLQALREHSQHE